ncbi:MAG: apolipoprotein N-acyltransferase [Planctomycetota bacterium]|nr:apolipoprotein N-acyltransferase [Planctomycetota bacterium]
MSKRRHALNPAKVKADMSALEQHPPREVFLRRLDIRRRLSVALLCILTSALLLACYTPFEKWYLAYVALVPWGLAVIGGHKGRWAILWGWLGGVIFWAAGIYWLTWITLGGYILLILYLGLYWMVAGLLVRRAFQRGWPVWITLPVVWVAMEYAQSFALWPMLPGDLSGFPWLLLAHSQYSCTRLIQIADVTGQYGVSFFIAMVNGTIIDALSQPLFVRAPRGARLTRQIGAALGASIVAAAAFLGYGTYRLNQETTRLGPTVAVVQQAFPISLSERGASQQEIFGSHLAATRSLVGAGCDLVVWPESMLGFGNMDPEYWNGLNPMAYDPETNELIRTYQQNLRSLGRLVSDLDCPLLAGGSMPADQYGQDNRRYNSALLFGRDESGRLQIKGRYDKMHLVPFSECVPYRQSWPWLHRKIRRVVPDVMPQLEPGKVPVRFTISGQGDKEIRFAVPICYEGSFARVCRRMVVGGRKKRVDMLINISNDGWFVWRTHAGTELDQHLSQYVFRAIEGRVAVVRAVNTGISAYIDSTGRIREEVRHHGKRKMVAGNIVTKTFVDDRVSLYSLVGDVFAQAVCLAAGAGIMVMFFRRRA